MPFGRGHHWLNNNSVASKILGGFQMTSLINVSSGAPISILDTRGTLNRAGRSGLQPASSSLTPQQIKALTGIFKTPNGVFFINPKVLQATSSVTGSNVFYDLTQPLPANIPFNTLTIRGASPIGTAPFAGQVFFFNNPGSTGTLPMNFINGPIYFNWNAGMFRNLKVGEKRTIQLRMEVFNALNHPNFDNPRDASVGSPSIRSSVFAQTCCATVAPPSTQTIVQTGESARVIQLAMKLQF